MPLKLSDTELGHLAQRQELLGERFATIRPHRLYPLDEYFGVTTASLMQVSGGYSTPRQIVAGPPGIALWPLPTKRKRQPPIIIPRSLALAA